MDSWRTWRTDVDIPALLLLPGGFLPGRRYRFKGTVRPDCEKFILNFQSGKDTEPFCYPVPLRLTFNFKEHLFSRNDWDPEWDGWGVDETDGKMPLRLGNSFELMVTCTENFVLVDVGEERICEFLHRQEPRDINYLTIWGDVALDVIEYSQ